MSAGERLPGTPTPMHTWTGAGGLTIAGDTWGDPNGPLVVLQHGGGQTRHAWKGAGETLGNVRLGADGKYHWHWDPARRRMQGDQTAHRERLHACANRLHLPTLLVRGGLSDVLSEAGAQSFLAQCPHAEYVNVANAAHMVAGDRNDILAESVIGFLKRVVPPI